MQREPLRQQPQPSSEMNVWKRVIDHPLRQRFLELQFASSISTSFP
jgi:hypothetical protein